MKSPLEYFSTVKDPRAERTKDYRMADIIFITIAAVICGAETWNEIELYGKTKESWLRTILSLPNGIPSHDTFNRFYSSVDLQQLEDSFTNWIKDVAQITDGEIISIYGKSIRGSGVKNSKAMVQMMSAWANQNHMVLGQVKTFEKSNEITDIQKLLDILVLKGSMITIDAMGCQTEIAKKIVDKNADYVLAVKGNQGTLEEDIQYTIKTSKPVDTYKHVDMGHGKIETRICNVYNDLNNIENVSKWEGLKTIVQIESTRYIKSSGKEQKETRLYISNLELIAKTNAEIIRGHWGVENSLHWILDVALNEDKGIKTNAIGVENFSIINRIALNLLKNKKSKKVCVKSRRLGAGWDNNYLLTILKN